MFERELTIPTHTTILSAHLRLPDTSRGLVISVQGTHGKPEHEQTLERAMSAALARVDLASMTVELDFGIHGHGHGDEHAQRHAMHVLGQRLVATTSWLRDFPDTRDLPIGYFGLELGAGAAITSAVACTEDVSAVATYDAPMDLVARDMLARLKAPLLLLVRSGDAELATSTSHACTHLRAEHAVHQVHGGGSQHGAHATCDQIAKLASDWFARHMTKRPTARRELAQNLTPPAR